MSLTWVQLIAFGLGTMMLGVMACFGWFSILLGATFRDDPSIGLLSGFAGLGFFMMAILFFLFAIIVG